MNPLLIEIGTEEIPARFIPGGMRALKDGLTKVLCDASIGFENVFEYGAPRRLAVFIENVEAKQKEKKVEVLGPPKKAALDKNGNYTAAAKGFAKSRNIDIERLKVIKTERGEYISATVKEPPGETTDILEQALPKMITSLHFPKSMRWGNGDLRFVRPIQWITAIYNNSVIPFDINGIKSGNMTRGHRFLSPGAFKIRDTTTYLHVLSNNSVIADPEKRKEIILDGIRKIDSDLNCKVHEDKELLDTVTYLIEFPTVVLGGFDAGYLALPKELLITCMKVHQKYFSVEDSDENLMPYFVLVSNTLKDNNETVQKGAERVLRARLEDAKFYFNDDQKKPLREYAEKLKEVTFQEKLGSVYEKTDRIASVCSFLAEALGMSDKETTSRAVRLCKADLVTGIVREFPELQGYIGMIYARRSGESDEISTAIYEHYMPRFSGDTLPSNDLGTLISLSDKIDNIASLFAVGLIPTGSEDPFALRRQAIGIINILRSKDYDLSLDSLIDKALEVVRQKVPVQEDLNIEILKFFNQRLEGMFLAEGFSYDLIDAVLSIQERTGTGARYNLSDIKNRLETLSLMRKEPGFPDLVTAAKRVCNILRGAPSAGGTIEDALHEHAEKELFRAAKKAGDKLTKTGYRSLLELTKPVNTFFDSVLVMDKDPDVKRNRLSLLADVKALFDSLGDFSKIVD